MPNQNITLHTQNKTPWVMEIHGENVAVEKSNSAVIFHTGFGFEGHVNKDRGGRFGRKVVLLESNVNLWIRLNCVF
jgi:hypothetical protein